MGTIFGLCSIFDLAVMLCKENYKLVCFRFHWMRNILIDCNCIYRTAELNSDCVCTMYKSSYCARVGGCVWWNVVILVCARKHSFIVDFFQGKSGICGVLGNSL